MQRIRLERLVAALLALSLLLVGCPGSRRAPAPPPDIERAWETLDAYCEAHGDDQVLCQRAGFLEARDVVIELWGAAQGWRVEAERARGHAGVDAAVHAGEKARLEREVKQEKAMHWVWGSVGAAISAVLVGLVAGLTR